MTADESTPWLVVGLGNPGREYSANRHNVGFMVADVLAARVGARWGRHRRAAAEVGEGRLGAGLGTPRIILVKPLTYMNLSGDAVGGIAQFYKVPIERIVAIHDELDIPFDDIRIKRGGGEGGHNGLRSMSRSLGSKEYARIRFGVGRPPGRMDPAAYVLANFTSVERKELDFLVDRAADVAEAVVQHGVEWAQNTYHGT